MQDRKAHIDQEFTEKHEQLFHHDQEEMDEFYKNKLHNELKLMKEASKSHKTSLHTSIPVRPSKPFIQ